MPRPSYTRIRTIQRSASVTARCVARSLGLWLHQHRERLTDRSCEQGYYRKGLVMARLEDEDAAEKLFQHALTLQPRDPAAIQRALSAIGTKTPAELVRGLRVSE